MQTPSQQNKDHDIQELSRLILSHGGSLKSKVVTAGFDGFVDTIIKVIKSKEAGSPHVFFNTTTEFGKYILEKGGSSFGLELEERNIKLGGNMPIMANALGIFGAHVNCIGALGYPELHHVFKNLSPNCHLYSFSAPAGSSAFEFNDGKIMFAQMGELNSFGWEKIKQVIGIKTLIELFRSSDLLCIVNWSEIDVSSDIWSGLLRDVMPEYEGGGKRQISFFDLSDFSKRSQESILRALTLLQAFGKYTDVTLSLNKNETRSIFEIIFNEPPLDDIAAMGKRIYEQLGVQILLLHSPKHAMAIHKDEISNSDTFFVAHPKLSTGAGDHFNAGFSAARLLGLEMQSCLMLANAVSAYYVTTGITPTWEEVARFLSGQVKNTVQ